MSSDILSTAMNPLVHVYFFNPVTGTITYQAMRSPGAVPSNSPRLQYIPGQRKPLTLGKDTRGLIEDLIVRGNHAVYFIANPPSRWEPLSDKQRKDKIRRAKVQVRQMELKALEQDAALIDDNDNDNDNDDDPDDQDDSLSNSSYSHSSISLSTGDCSDDISILSTEESQYSRDCFTFEDSLSADDTDGEKNQHEADQVQADDNQHQGDQDNGDNIGNADEDVGNKVQGVIAPVLPSLPSVATPHSLPSGTPCAAPTSGLSRTTSTKLPMRRLPRHRQSVRGKPSPLRRLAHPALAEEPFYSVPEGEDAGIRAISVPPPSDSNGGERPSIIPTLGMQGEQRSSKRKAYNDLRKVVKKLKAVHPPGTPTQTALRTNLARCSSTSKASAPSASNSVVSIPAPQQQTVSLKRKREDDEDDRKAPRSCQHDNTDSCPAAKKPKVTVTPLPAGNRRRRPKDRRPLARKMWDKLLKTKVAALRLGATFSDFGFLPVKKARRPQGPA